MKIAAITCMLASLAAVAAQEAAFDVPTAYSVDRYEAGWNTNPFTLKTAPPAVEKISTFKDLTLGSMYQYEGDSRVTLINVKTRERIRLSSTKVDPSGMRIKSANMLARRADSYAEIEKDGETAVLRYDEKLLATLASGQIAQHAGPDAGNPNMAEMAAGGGPGGIPSTLPGANPPRGRPLSGAPPPPMSSMPNNAAVNGLPNTGEMPLPNRNGSGPPTRRRLLTAPQQSRPSPPPPSGMPLPVVPP